MKQLQNDIISHGGRIIILVLILSFFYQLKAQDSTYVSVAWDSPYLQEYKTTIAKAFKTDSVDKININFYIRLTDTSYTDVFGGDEIFTIALIAKKYEKIFNNMQYFNNFRFEFSTPIGNDQDSILKYSTKYIKENENKVKNNIYKSDLDSCQKQFLIVLTDFYAFHSCDCDTIFRKKLIADSKLYLNNCNDLLVPLIVNTMAIKYEVSNWGVDINFYSGGLFMTNNLNNYFDSPSVCSELEMGILYKRLSFKTSGTWSYKNKINKDFFYKTNWQNTHKYYIGFFKFQIGYAFEFSRTSITPFITYSPTEIIGYNSQDSLYFSDIHLVNPNKISFGLMLKYNILKNKIKFYDTGCKLEKSNYPIILKFQYQNPRFDKLIPELSGNIFMISFGIGINSYFTKKIKLDY